MRRWINLENLKYIIEDSTIAELLGVQNFNDKESAVLELVKNSYDAKSEKVTIEISKDSITITDDGDGMTSEDIMSAWMHVGKSNKGYLIKDRKGNKRVLAGSKGIGRFALARLGANVEVCSLKYNEDAVVWKTNWNKSSMSSKHDLLNVGTVLKISQLRDRWSEKAIQNLEKYLSRTYNDSSMDIIIKVLGKKPVEVNRYFDEPELGQNCSAIINLSYVAETQKFTCSIISDEFQEKIKEYVPYNFNRYTKIINAVEVLDATELDIEQENLKATLSSLGNFSAQLYFGLNKVNEVIQKKFLYKRTELLSKYEHGVVLYRNAFSISSHEGTSDWLGLGARSRKSPAAATHPTGAWRVRENQLAGKVLIDKKDNKNLKDLSNRQGLDKNNHYKVFLNLIDLGLREFEYYRQSIIRNINVKNEDIVTIPKLIDDVIKDPKKIIKMTESKVQEFVVELKDMKRKNTDHQKVMTTTEKRYKYDIRILNVLATLGLKASSIAHEMKNDRNTIRNTRKFVKLALEDLGYWDIVEEASKSKPLHLDIPTLLDRNQTVNDRIMKFMNIMLDEIKVERFEPTEINISEVINKYLKLWRNDYSWVEIDSDIDKNIIIKLPEDIIGVILDNLILNSIQQNDDSNSLNIQIKVTSQNNILYFEYYDNGVGLDSRYKSEPFRILEVHETSKDGGHGLGMWIVNNSVSFTKGSINLIESNNDFRIHFSLGGK